MSQKICIIAALCEKNNVIGNEGKIPWHIKEDFQLFKEKTLNSSIIMGRLTWESLPIKPLKNRQNIVVSSQSRDEYEHWAKDLQTAILYAKLTQCSENIWLIGGSRIYEEGLELCDELHLSFVKGEFEGDTYFPKIPENFVEDETKRKNFDKFVYKVFIKN